MSMNDNVFYEKDNLFEKVFVHSQKNLLNQIFYSPRTLGLIPSVTGTVFFFQANP